MLGLPPPAQTLRPGPSTSGPRRTRFQGYNPLFLKKTVPARRRSTSGITIARTPDKCLFVRAHKCHLAAAYSVTPTASFSTAT